MNYGIVVKLIGKLLYIEAIALCLPLLVSFIYGEKQWISFVITIFICLCFAFLLSTRKGADNKIKIREGFAIVTFGWLFFSLFGALPFVFSGAIPSYIDALFETVSGFTTTGASILTQIEGLPYGILFWRSFTHWLGGMGILVFTVAVLPAMDAGSFQILKAESPGPVTEKVVPRVKDTAKIFYLLYIGMTILEIILLMLGGLNLFDASVHTFGTVATGGFSDKNASVGYYTNPYVIWVITIFMFLSGTNFSLYYISLKGRVRDALKDAEFRFYLFVTLSAAVLITTDLMLHHFYASGLFETLRHAFFQTSSIITTTGFATADFDKWPFLSKAVLFFLFFIGGCSGSTGGSIKNIRILVCLKSIRREFKKTIHPRAVMPIKVNGKSLNEDTIGTIKSFVLLYFLLTALGTVLITSLEGIDFVSAISSVSVCLGNIGPGFGLVGPTCNYFFLSNISKLFLTFLMLIGRLELFTVLALFFPAFWKD